MFRKLINWERKDNFNILNSMPKSHKYKLISKLNNQEQLENWTKTVFIKVLKDLTKHTKRRRAVIQRFIIILLLVGFITLIGRVSYSFIVSSLFTPFLHDEHDLWSVRHTTVDHTTSHTTLRWTELFTHFISLKMRWN